MRSVCSLQEPSKGVRRGLREEVLTEPVGAGGRLFSSVTGRPRCSYAWPATVSPTLDPTLRRMLGRASHRGWRRCIELQGLLRHDWQICCRGRHIRSAEDKPRCVDVECSCRLALTINLHKLSRIANACVMTFVPSSTAPAFPAGHVQITHSKTSPHYILSS